MLSISNPVISNSKFVKPLVEKNSIFNVPLESKSTNFIYFGLKKMLMNHSFTNIKYQWGWKDPSNTFTLPIWLSIFNNAKVIYVLRHPLDVSRSLLNRNNMLKKRDLNNIFPSFFSKYLSLLTITQGGISCSFNINNIDECLSLYNYYYNEIILHKGKHNILFIKYEDLLLNTEKIIAQLFSYIGKDFNEEIYLNINSYINSSRCLICSWLCFTRCFHNCWM